MRPRSKLLSKRRLMLPTITEGNEETVKELNGVNALHNADQSQAVSSEDYLLSICHLARPTRDVSLDNLHTQQHSAVLRKLRPSQLIRTTLTTFDFNLKEEAQVQADEERLNKSLICNNSDPLEYLYGHQNNISVLSGSVRRRFGRQHGRANCAESGSDFPCPHRSSHSETHANASALNVSPKHNISMSEVGKVCQEGKGAEGERLNPEIKQSLISQWISDCRSAWREARSRACALPAIAEV